MEKLQFDPDKIYQAVLKAAQAVWYFWLMTYVKLLAQVTKKIVWTWKKQWRRYYQHDQSMVELPAYTRSWLSTIAEHYISYRLQRDLEGIYGDHIMIPPSFEQTR